MSMLYTVLGYVDMFCIVGLSGLLSIGLLLLQFISCRKGVLQELMEWMPSVYMVATVMMLVYFLVGIATSNYTNTMLVHALVYLGLGSVHQIMLNCLKPEDQLSCN